MVAQIPVAPFRIVEIRFFLVCAPWRAIVKDGCASLCLLYALQSDRFPELMAMTDDSELRGEYEHAADSLGELAPQDYALEHGYDPSTGDRYRKVLNSFYADWHRPETLARSKSIRRDCLSSRETGRGVCLSRQSAVNFGLNVGNVNAWLKNGTCRR